MGELDKGAAEPWVLNPLRIDKDAAVAGATSNDNAIWLSTPTGELPLVQLGQIGDTSHLRATFFGVDINDPQTTRSFRLEGGAVRVLLPLSVNEQAVLRCPNLDSLFVTVSPFP